MRLARPRERLLLECLVRGFSLREQRELERWMLTERIRYGIILMRAISTGTLALPILWGAAHDWALNEPLLLAFFPFVTVGAVASFAWFARMPKRLPLPRGLNPYP